MTDRLSLIKARHAEAGGGDGDLEWLVAEVERLRRAMPPVVVTYAAFAQDRQYGIYDTKALLARAERERRHGEWAMRRVELLKGQRNSAVHAFLDESLNSGRGEYRP